MLRSLSSACNKNIKEVVKNAAVENLKGVRVALVKANVKASRAVAEGAVPVSEARAERKVVEALLAVLNKKNKPELSSTCR